MRLAEDSLIPLYEQVMADIRQGIEGGHYHAGEKIPSESELSEMYQVSRITIRRAIEELSSEGFLTKRQGKGTYVNPPKLKKKIMQRGPLQSLTELCAEYGRVAGARTLGVSRIKACGELANKLALEEGAKVISVRRIRTVDGNPMIEETTFFPADEYAFIENEGLDDASIFSTFALHDCRMPARMVNVEVEMVRANAKLSEELHVSLGEPMFSEVGTVVDDQGVPVFVGRLLVLASQFGFRIL